MKYQLEQNDINYIDLINKSLQDGEIMPLFIPEKDRKYYLEFTCVDIAKANAFIANIMSQNREKAAELENALGIRVDSINYCQGDSKLNNLKEYLRKTLDQLERM